jgi:hypothetical protein
MTLQACAQYADQYGRDPAASEAALRIQYPEITTVPARGAAVGRARSTAPSTGYREGRTRGLAMPGPPIGTVTLVISTPYAVSTDPTQNGPVNGR